MWVQAFFFFACLECFWTRSGDIFSNTTKRSRFQATIHPSHEFCFSWIHWWEDLLLYRFTSPGPKKYSLRAKKKPNSQKDFLQIKTFAFVQKKQSRKFLSRSKKKKQIVLGAPRLIKISDVTQVSFNPDSKFFFSGTTFTYFGWLEVKKTFSSKRKFLAPTNEILFVSWYLKHVTWPSFVGLFQACVRLAFWKCVIPLPLWKNFSLTSIEQKLS